MRAAMRSPLAVEMSGAFGCASTGGRRRDRVPFSECRDPGGVARNYRPGALPPDCLLVRRGFRNRHRSGEQESYSRCLRW